MNEDVVRVVPLLHSQSLADQDVDLLLGLLVLFLGLVLGAPLALLALLALGLVLGALRALLLLMAFGLVLRALLALDLAPGLVLGVLSKVSQ